MRGRQYDAPPTVTSVPPTKKPKPETKTVRLPLVVKPSFARVWKEFCAEYNMSMTAATETAMTLYMQAIRDQDRKQA